MSNIPELQPDGAILACEQIYLGSLLLDPDLWGLVALCEDDFFYSIHRQAFNKIRWYAKDPENFPITKLVEDLAQHALEDKEDVRKYLFGLLESAKSTNNFASYQDIIREKSVYRKLKELAVELQFA